MFSCVGLSIYIPVVVISFVWRNPIDRRNLVVPGLGFVDSPVYSLLFLINIYQGECSSELEI